MDFIDDGSVEMQRRTSMDKGRRPEEISASSNVCGHVLKQQIFAAGSSEKIQRSNSPRTVTSRWSMNYWVDWKVTGIF